MQANRRHVETQQKGIREEGEENGKGEVGGGKREAKGK